MPNISQRGVNMPASPIRKLVPLANQAKAKGIKVYLAQYRASRMCRSTRSRNGGDAPY